MTLALLLKIAIPPVLVALMSLAARRWGPTVGGLIMGLPWMTGPVLLFLALDKGIAFAVDACRGAELAVWGMGAFIVGYGTASRALPWWGSLPAGIVGFFAVAWLTAGFDIGLLPAAISAAIVLIVTFLLLARPATSAVAGGLPWWDIPARMAATFALVAVIMTSADLLGGQLSGIAASYPVILTVVGSFTHAQWGRDAILRVLRGISLSLLAFVAFFAVVGSTLPVLGPVAAFAAATPVALAVSAGLVAFNRWQGRRRRG